MTRPYTVEMGTSDEARRQRLAEILGRLPEDLRIAWLPVGLSGGEQSDTGFVVDEAGRRIAVLKVPHDTREFGRELSAYERLKMHRERLRLWVPEVLHIGRTRRGSEEAGFLLLSVGPGHHFDNMFRAVSRASPASPERRAALGDLDRAVSAWSRGLADLHSLPPGSGGRVGRGYIHRYIARFDERLERLDGLAVPEAIVGHFGGRRDDLVAGLRRNPGPSALVHGDSHPRNILYDPQSGAVGLIDLPRLHESMDAGGRPIGSPARDVVYSLRHPRLPPDDIAHLLGTFSASYRGAGGPGMSPEAFDFFWDYRAVGMVAKWGREASDHPESVKAVQEFRAWAATAMLPLPEIG